MNCRALKLALAILACGAHALVQSNPLPSLDEAVRSKTDLWGEAAMRERSGEGDKKLDVDRCVGKFGRNNAAKARPARSDRRGQNRDEEPDGPEQGKMKAAEHSATQAGRESLLQAEDGANEQQRSHANRPQMVSEGLPGGGPQFARDDGQKQHSLRG